MLPITEPIFMKFIISLALAISLSVSTFSQNLPLIEVDDPPKLKNSCADNNTKDCFESSLKLFVAENINMKNLVRGKAGTAYAQFVITEEGKITNIRVRANSKTLKKEAERLVKTIPIAESAKRNEEKIGMIYTLPVKFRKKHFNSYDDYFKSKDKSYDLSFTDLTEVPTVPHIENYERDRKTLQNKFRKDLAQKLKNRQFRSSDIKNMRLTFLINTRSEITNIIVVSKREKLQKEVKSILSETNIIKPAIGYRGTPVTVRVIYRFEDI